MILIADSGSTKTAWRLIDGHGKIHQMTSEGLNPLHLSMDEITEHIRESILAPDQFSAGSVEKVFFYGAGCTPGEASDRMTNVLSSSFPQANVEVADDMLAVARGVCGHDPGIACILGTGSNSCMFDGTAITFKVPALGFILGDEGSGAWLGKSFLASFIRNELPVDLASRFKKQYKADRGDILQSVYRGERPAAYLAGFSRFLFRHRSDPYVSRLVYRGFGEFLEKNVIRYDNYASLPVHFSGSIAFYYASILRKAASDKGITVRNIVEGPIAGLALYHQQSNEK